MLFVFNGSRSHLCAKCIPTWNNNADYIIYGNTETIPLSLSQLMNCLSAIMSVHCIHVGKETSRHLPKRTHIFIATLINWWYQQAINTFLHVIP